MKNVHEAALSGELKFPEGLFKPPRSYNLIKVPIIVFGELIPLSHSFLLKQDGNSILYNTITNREYFTDSKYLPILAGGQVNRFEETLMINPDLSRGYIPKEIVDCISEVILNEYNKKFGVTILDPIRTPKNLEKEELETWKDYISE